MKPQKIIYPILIIIFIFIIYAIDQHIYQLARRLFRPNYYFLETIFPFLLGLAVNLDHLKTNILFNSQKKLNWPYILLAVVIVFLFPYFYSRSIHMLVMLAYALGNIATKLFVIRE